ncbi:hypothetical protein H4R27_000125 [Coemansia aciculifera]|nr:hypothetical protein H4R27_000125 [Coemansia aciculifera]
MLASHLDKEPTVTTKGVETSAEGTNDEVLARMELADPGVETSAEGTNDEVLARMELADPGVETSAEGTNDEVLAPKELVDLGLAIHSQTGIVICRHCKHGPELDRLSGHDCFKSRYAKVAIPGLVAAAMRVIRRQPHALHSVAEIKAWLERQRGTVHAELPLIEPCVPGFKCVECGHMFRLRPNASFHYKNEHSAITPNGPTSVAVHMQKPFRIILLNQFVEVKPRPRAQHLSSDPGLQPLLEQLEHAASAPRRTLTDCHQSNASTKLWIRDVGWDHVIRHVGFRASYSAMCNPELRQAWDSALASVVGQAFDSVQAGIDIACPNYLRALGTSGILTEKPNSRHTWRHIDSNGPQYRSTLVAFLATVLVAATASEGTQLLQLLELSNNQVKAARAFCDVLVAQGTSICRAESLVPDVSKLFWAFLETLFAYAIRDTERAHKWWQHPILIFLCLRAWDGSQLLEPNRLRPLTAHLIYWIRATVYTLIETEFAKANECNASRVAPASTICEHYSAADVYRVAMASKGHTFTGLDLDVKGKVVKAYHFFVRDNCPTPCGALFHAAQIFLNAEGMLGVHSEIEWVTGTGFKEMVYKQQSIKMSDIADAYNCALNDIKSTITNMTQGLHEDIMSKIPSFDKLADNCAKSTAGHSFLTADKNDLGSPLDRALFLHYLKNGQFTNAGMSGFDKPAMRKWLDDMDDLMDKIMFAIHLSASQPARAPELASITIQNDELSLRGIFIKHLTMCLATTYWKGRNTQHRDC